MVSLFKCFFPWWTHTLSGQLASLHQISPSFTIRWLVPPLEDVTVISVSLLRSSAVSYTHLDVYKRQFNPCGSFVVCLDEESLPDLRALYERGVKNGVKDLEIITDKARIKEMEPNLADEAAGVL